MTTSSSLSPLDSCAAPNIDTIVCCVHSCSDCPGGSAIAAWRLRQVLEREPDDLGEGLEHALAARRDRGEGRAAAGVQAALQRLRLHHLGQVALVVLHHHRDRGGVELLREQVSLQLPVGLLILLPAVGRRVGDEHDPVRPAQHHAARRRVDRLAGHGGELEAQVVAHEPGRLQRQQVAQDGAILLRVHRDELAAPPVARAVVEHLQVGGLAADRRAVVGDLDPDRAFLAIELDHEAVLGDAPELYQIAPRFASPARALLHFLSLRRAASSAGRAPGSQSGGRGFEPPAVHQAHQQLEAALRVADAALLPSCYRPPAWIAARRARQASLEPFGPGFSQVAIEGIPKGQTHVDAPPAGAPTTRLDTPRATLILRAVKSKSSHRRANASPSRMPVLARVRSIV